MPCPWWLPGLRPSLIACTFTRATFGSLCCTAGSCRYYPWLRPCCSSRRGCGPHRAVSALPAGSFVYTRMGWCRRLLPPGRKGASRGFASHPGPGERFRVSSVYISTAANVLALASATHGPFALVAQEARRALGASSALSASLSFGRKARPPWWRASCARLRPRDSPCSLPCTLHRVQAISLFFCR